MQIDGERVQAPELLSDTQRMFMFSKYKDPAAIEVYCLKHHEWARRWQTPKPAQKQSTESKGPGHARLRAAMKDANMWSRDFRISHLIHAQLDKWTTVAV